MESPSPVPFHGHIDAVPGVTSVFIISSSSSQGNAIGSASAGGASPIPMMCSAATARAPEVATTASSDDNEASVR